MTHPHLTIETFDRLQEPLGDFLHNSSVCVVTKVAST